MHRAPQGAAATCCGGESQQVGDRSRTEDGRPEAAHVGIGDGKPGFCRGDVTDDWCDHRPLSRSGADGGRFDSARAWRGVRRGRTITTEGPGRCRNLFVC